MYRGRRREGKKEGRREGRRKALQGFSSDDGFAAFQ